MSTSEKYSHDNSGRSDAKLFEKGRSDRYSNVQIGEEVEEVGAVGHYGSA